MKPVFFARENKAGYEEPLFLSGVRGPGGLAD